MADSAPKKGMILIVGGSSGMGKATAISALRAGYSVHIAGSSAEKLAKATAEITAETAGSIGILKSGVLDATKEESLDAFFKQIEAGSLQHIVITMGPSLDVSSIIGAEGLRGLRKQFDMKFFAQIGVVSYGAPLIADGGCIVLTSGALAKRPGKGSTALATANAALDSIVKGLANDLGPRLRINCLSPGLVDTEIWANMPPEVKKGMLTGFGQNIPAGRAGVPSDISSGIMFLLENTWVTGTVLDVDGGAAVRK